MDENDIEINRIVDDANAVMPVLDAIALGICSEPIERCGSLLRLARARGWIDGGSHPGTVPQLTSAGLVLVKALKAGAQ